MNTLALTPDARRLTPDWLSDQARQRPAAPAVITRESTLTYAELDARASTLAETLVAAGVVAGEPIAARLPLTLDSVAAIHAVARVSAVLVPLNLRLTPDETAWQVAHVGARFVLNESVLTGEAREAKRASLPTSPTAIVFTSGTSGRPKGAMLTRESFFWSAMASALRIGTLPDDRWLCPLPLFHVGGLSIVWRSVLYGTAMVLATSSRVEDLARDLRDTGATLVSLVPTQLHRLLEHGAASLRGVRLVLLGGAAATPELMTRAQRVGVHIAPTYGLTETTSQIATQRPEDALRKPGSVGKALPWSRLRVVDDAGADAATGQPGEIVIDGPTVFAGYWGDPDATAAALRDGALHTGDIGYFDADGDLWVLQRRTDLIVSGGENVYPAEVEAVLAQHPAVSQVCVVGLPDAEWGQRVAAAIVPQPDVALVGSDLLAFARARLAGYKVPRELKLVEALPLTSSGKIVRREVVGLFQAADLTRDAAG